MAYTKFYYSAGARKKYSKKTSKKKTKKTSKRKTCSCKKVKKPKRCPTGSTRIYGSCRTGVPKKADLFALYPRAIRMPKRGGYKSMNKFIQGLQQKGGFYPVSSAPMDVSAVPATIAPPVPAQPGPPVTDFGQVIGGELGANLGQDLLAPVGLGGVGSDIGRELGGMAGHELIRAGADFGKTFHITGLF